jgi:signal transduction histidine kinase
MARSFDGNGLASMSHRAERMGGRLEVVSRNGEGTALTLKVPLN